MNIIDGNGASEVLRLSALHANKVVKTQVQKKPPLSDSICIRCGAKAGLEPARISTVDFESTASTDFATSALKRYAENVVDYTCRTPPCKRQLARTSLSAEIFSIAYSDV